MQAAQLLVWLAGWLAVRLLTTCLGPADKSNSNSSSTALALTDRNGGDGAPSPPPPESDSARPWAATSPEGKEKARAKALERAMETEQVGGLIAAVMWPRRAIWD